MDSWCSIILFSCSKINNTFVLVFFSFDSKQNRFFNPWLYRHISCIIKQNEEYSVKQKRNQNEPYMISPALVCDDFTIYPMRRRCSINFISWSKYISSICFEAAVRDFFNEETEDHRCSCDPEERKYCWSNAWYDDTKANSCKYNECEPDGWKWQRIKT